MITTASRFWHGPLFTDLDFSFLEMNPFTLIDGEPYPLDMRGELDDTAAFKNFNKYWSISPKLYFLFPFKLLVDYSEIDFDFIMLRWGNIDFPLPFGRVLSPTESFIHGLDEKVIHYVLV